MDSGIILQNPPTELSLQKVCLRFPTSKLREGTKCSGQIKRRTGEVGEGWSWSTFLQICILWMNMGKGGGRRNGKEEGDSGVLPIESVFSEWTRERRRWFSSTSHLYFVNDGGGRERRMWFWNSSQRACIWWIKRENWGRWRRRKGMRKGMRKVVLKYIQLNLYLVTERVGEGRWWFWSTYHLYFVNERRGRERDVVWEYFLLSLYFVNERKGGGEDKGR